MHAAFEKSEPDERAMMRFMATQQDACVTPERLRAVAVEASKAAGRILLNFAKEGFTVQRKNPIDLVTDADHAAEQCIIDHIRRHFPSHQTLAEERGADTHFPSRYRWIIDPLDGTTNFAHGFPVYAVSIGVECDGQAVIGVVYDPSRDELFTAEAGHGAHVSDRLISVSQTPRLGEALTVTGFSYDIRETLNNNLDHFVRFALAAEGVRRTGSAALDLCYVAAGRFDGFWEIKLNPWDMAAGVLIVREAGGCVTDLRGNAHSIYQPELVASNGRIHDEMLDVIRDSLRP